MDKLPTNKKPVSVDLMPTQDRRAVLVVIRSEDPIPIQETIDALESFLHGLKIKRAQATALSPVPKSILLP